MLPLEMYLNPHLKIGSNPDCILTLYTGRNSVAALK